MADLIPRLHLFSKPINNLSKDWHAISAAPSPHRLIERSDKSLENSKPLSQCSKKHVIYSDNLIDLKIKTTTIISK
jgi:hypothetical protein